MTVTLEIPPDVEAELSERAAHRGQAISEYFLTLAEADLYGEHELSEQEHGEEAALLQVRIQDRISGDKGILLEDYWAEVTAKREARIPGRTSETAV